VTHTGALAGEDDVASAFLADCGIARVESLEGLLEALPLVRRTPIRSAAARQPRVAVLTTTAGGAIMVVDPLAMRGVEIMQPSAETFARFAAQGIEATPARIVDLTIAGAKYEVYKGALDILTTAPEFDMVLAVVGSSARFQPEQAVNRLLTVPVRQSDRGVSGPRGAARLAMLSEAGVPRFARPKPAPMPSRPRSRAARRSRPLRFLRAAMAACSTNWKPTRCSIASAFRGRPRSRSKRRSPGSPPCLSPTLLP